MRKTITALLAVGLIAGAFVAPAADAAKKKKKKPYTRVVTDSYASPAIGVSTPVVAAGPASARARTSVVWSSRRPRRTST